MTALRGWLDRVSGVLPAGVATTLQTDAAREVRGFPGPITDVALERALTKSTDVTRYRVIGRRIFRLPRARAPEKAWLEATERGFEEMLSRLVALIPQDVPIPDFDFAVNLGDYPVRGAPILTWWSCEGFGNARIPSGVHWETDRTVPLEDPSVRGDRRFDPRPLATPWSERESRVVWRGSATGMYDRTFRHWRLRRLLGRPLGRGVTRLDLCRISEAHPAVVDAAITGWPQVSGRIRERLEERYRTAPRVRRSWYLRYRYVINVDGNVATSSFLTFVGSGTAVLKQESPYRDWCGDHLRAHEHYLPVARDLSDLVEVARGALADPVRGAEVARAGREFAERHLSGTAIDYYTLALLDRYSEVAPRPSEPGRSAHAVG